MAMLVAERTALGDRLAQLRVTRDLSQRQLGLRVGVSPQTVSNWERGVSRVPSDQLPLVAQALGVSVTDLYSDDATDSGRTPRPGDGTRFSDSLNVRPLEEQRLSGAKPLPIYRWGSLGDPRDRESSPHPDREEYPPAGRERLIGPNGFGVEVKGNSMVGRDLHDGDVCWVNPDRAYRLGDLVLALVTDANGESGMVIKSYARTDVGDSLVSETEQGKVLMVCSEFKIVGPVVGVQRWFPPR